ncbi:DUF1957 domain-containing protein [bacterium]|nr:DUF1957 domain-containing protein [bacterium]
METVGSFVLVLHSHLPYVVNNGTWPFGIDWLYEAAAETYIPLINVLNELADENLNFGVTIGITPVLLEQLDHKVFKKGFVKYLNQNIKFAKKNADFFKNENDLHKHYLATQWEKIFTKHKKDFLEKFNSDLIGEFKKLQEKGFVDLLTSGATHGYFPLLSDDKLISSQIKIGVDTYKKFFGKEPTGMWLPECAYRPAYSWRPNVNSELGFEPKYRKGIEALMNENKIHYFFTDFALVQNGNVSTSHYTTLNEKTGFFDFHKKEFDFRTTKSLKTPFRPYCVISEAFNGEAAVAFVRDPETARQVWSGEIGYPGSPEYLDFHKKHSEGGLRYWKVTDNKLDMAFKHQYYPQDVPRKIEENAHHFAELVYKVLDGYKLWTGTEGILVAPFDTELFGHWWFEGPQFLKTALKKIAQNPRIKTQTAKNYFQSKKSFDVASLAEGSWGENNNHNTWLTDDPFRTTTWTWTLVYNAEKLFKEKITYYKNVTDTKIIEILNQVARELLLIQSSDWQFLITTISAKEYAERRINRHYVYFKRLLKIVKNKEKNGKLTKREENFFKGCCKKDSVFKEIDFRDFIS